MTTHVAFLLPAEQPTALDFVAPWEVFGRWMHAELHLVSSVTGLVRCDTGVVVEVRERLEDVPSPDIVVVPGTSRPFSAMQDRAAVEWLRAAAPTARWVTSVCTGSGVLAVAGLLHRKRATTHWAFRDELTALGVDVVPERVVVDGNVVTAGGITAGLDMALQLSVLELGQATAEAIQLSLEYDPAPPVDSGSPAVAAPETIGLVRQFLQHTIDADKPSAWPGELEVARVAGR